MKRAGLLLIGGLLIGSVLSIAITDGIVSAQVIQSWPKDQVMAVVLVKPSFGVFVPADGDSIGVNWTKDQVVPISLVKPSTGGFVPLEGTSIGNTWPKDEVKPVVFVEPSFGVFVPATTALSGAQSAAPATNLPRAGQSRSPTCDPAIETRIDGDFNGWEGETLYKMDDGSIWKQSNYHYHYHYTYHPSVTIYPNSLGACHIKVEGDSDDGVDVIRIK